ncbi:low temperature requirement A protein (LtrA) [Streptomyces sp. CEV 2-1]|nr:low temperature requirement A protein (LtrA) [Streptomyces sp. CEV 2-1]
MVQVGWVVRLALPEGSGLATFAVLVVAEIAVPVWAERAAVTTWHPHHIAERYGLFTLIVLGESITAATGAVHASLDTHAALGDLAALVVGGILTVFALWWLYFAQNAPQRLTTLRVALLWGYGHYFVFASAAAVGAGLALNVSHATGHGHLSDHAAAAAYTVPVAVFIALVWLLHHPTPVRPDTADIVHPVAVAAILAATFTPSPVLVTGILAALLIAAKLSLSARGTTKAGTAQAPRTSP